MNYQSSGSYHTLTHWQSGHRGNSDKIFTTKDGNYTFTTLCKDGKIIPYPLNWKIDLKPAIDKGYVKKEVKSKVIKTYSDTFSSYYFPAAKLRYIPGIVYGAALDTDVLENESKKYMVRDWNDNDESFPPKDKKWTWWTAKIVGPVKLHVNAITADFQNRYNEGYNVLIPAGNYTFNDLQDVLNGNFQKPKSINISTDEIKMTDTGDVIELDLNTYFINVDRIGSFTKEEEPKQTDYPDYNFIDAPRPFRNKIDHLLEIIHPNIVREVPDVEGYYDVDYHSYYGKLDYKFQNDDNKPDEPFLPCISAVKQYSGEKYYFPDELESWEWETDGKQLAYEYEDGIYQTGFNIQYLKYLDDKGNISVIQPKYRQIVTHYCDDSPNTDNIFTNIDPDYVHFGNWQMLNNIHRFIIRHNFTYAKETIA